VKAGNRFPFRPGMTASVDIITSRKDRVLSVPLAAVTTRNPNQPDGEQNKQGGGPPAENVSANQPAQPKKDEDKTVIFVNNKGVAKMVEVKTGISDYDNIEILSGISDSTEVVKGPFLAVSKRLKDGDKIRQAEVKKKEQKDEAK
jgi:HlyD family secretion protein